MIFGLPQFSVKRKCVFPFPRDSSPPQNAYKTLQLLYTLDKSLFSNINHNYIFSIISHDVVDNESPFMSWYLTNFKYYIEYKVYQEHMTIMKYNGYVHDEINDEYFINACLKNYIDVVKKYQSTNYKLTRIGFEFKGDEG